MLASWPLSDDVSPLCLEALPLRNRLSAHDRYKRRHGVKASPGMPAAGCRCRRQDWVPVYGHTVTRRRIVA